jgi:thiamine-phosphate pyrophosphorylase
MTLASLARRLNREAGAEHLPPLILMTDDVRLPDPVPAVRTLPPGSGVILRHYGSPDRAALARALLPLCRAREIVLLVAGDPALAAAIGADGLHLPEAMVRPMAGHVLPFQRRGWIVTAAAHTPDALRRAARAGADAALLAPVFATASHPDVRPIGALRFAAWCRAATLPVYALGGIDAVTGRRLLNSGAAGIAGIGAIARSDHDHSETRRGPE